MRNLTHSWRPRRNETWHFSISFWPFRSAFDLAAHWVADEGWPPPDDAGSTFDLLAAGAAITVADADRLRAAAGLSNRIAHGYGMLDYRRVQSEALEGIPVLRRFLDTCARAAGL
jgi:uncharacterized protein YutE (UPF0331/DUF86 family)